MTRKVLTVFLDGLRADSVEYMPFLRNFQYRAHLQTLLGYSIACHATMYTGVYPDKHNYWFVWKRSPESSPFKPLKFINSLPFSNTLLVKLILHKIIRLFNKNNSSFFGIPRIIHLPVKYWSYLDVTEKKMYCDEHYVDNYLTLFDILRKERIRFEVSGMDKSDKEESNIVRKHKYSEDSQWIYLFMGDVDHFSHRYLQNSEEGIRRLRDLDTLIAQKYQEYQKVAGDFDFILFSDHGHIPVTQRIDVYEIFNKNKINLNHFFHIADVNYIRIWVDREKDKRAIEDVLESNLKGSIITDALLKEFRLPLRRSEHGDIIFYLDQPYIFSKTIWGFSNSIKSMHGYLPSYSDSDGVFLSNIPIKKERISLVDILPTHLKLFNISIPTYVEGESVW